MLHHTLSSKLVIGVYRLRRQPECAQSGIGPRPYMCWLSLVCSSVHFHPDTKTLLGVSSLSFWGIMKPCIVGHYPFITIIFGHHCWIYYYDGLNWLLPILDWPSWISILEASSISILTIMNLQYEFVQEWCAPKTGGFPINNGDET